MLTHFRMAPPLKRPLIIAAMLVVQAACSDDGTSDGTDAAIADAGTVADTTADTVPDDDDAADETLLIPDTADTLDDTDAEPIGVTTPQPRDASPCPDYTDRADEYSCARDGGRAGRCETDADCAGGLCQGNFNDFTGPSCMCFETLCTEDSDCGDEEACVCASRVPVSVSVPGTICGRGAPDGRCQSVCVPAGCRTNADCADGEICAAHHTECGEVRGFACWSADEAGCGTNEDCGVDRACMYSRGEWLCGPETAC